MKKINLLFFAGLVSALLSTSSLALTVPSGTTLTIGSVNISENIYVKPDATLIIDGDVIMGDPSDPSSLKYIIISDRGQVISNGGSLKGIPSTPVDYGSWGGIIIHATVFPESVFSNALDLNNFEIRNAQTAISMPRYRGTMVGEPVIFELVNRAISIKNTVFDQNQNSFRFNLDTYYAGSFWTDFNVTHGTNRVLFQNCEFLNNSSMWSFWIVKDHAITLEGCLFFNHLSSSNDLGVHLNSVTDCIIKDCVFKQTGEAGIVFHGGLSDEVLIDNNQFVFTESQPYPNGYAGIAVGYSTNEGIVKNMTITNNTFSGVPGIHAYGIVVGSGVDTPAGGFGYAGYLREGTIKHNSFNNFQYGISFTGEGSVHLAQNALGVSPQNIDISENEFKHYQYGLSLSYKAEGVDANCNHFGAGYNAFRIDNFLTTFQNWSGGDQGNQFLFNTLNIQNETSDPFIYDKSPFNPFPATSFSGPVSVVSNPLITFCLAKTASNEVVLNDENDFTVYPNPNTGVFTIESDLYHMNPEVQIKNIAGSTVWKGTLSDRSTTVSLPELLSGVYFIEILSNGSKKTERFIIQ